ncbi:MAG: DUF4125 family protein [Lachnospiraceae bacterium]|nr:DUF4125 family protein [Lachnospiraceae bacterium]
MNTEEILQTLDMLFDSHQLEQIEPFLMEQLDNAFAHGDYNCCITILNELIGYYRDMSRFDEMLAACDRATQFLEQLGLQDSIPYATTLLNIATALRAMGNYDAALEEYKKVFPIYQRELEPTDTRFAALYNNISLLYQEMGNLRQSVAAQNQALHILEGSDDTQKLAISHSNLGTTLLQMEHMDEALVHLNYAVQLFDSLPGDKDYHYSAALASLGQAYVMKEDYETARGYYLTALEEYRKTHGVTQSYYNLLDNLHYVEEQLGVEPTPDPAAGEQSEAELPTASAQSEPDTPKTAAQSEPDMSATAVQDEPNTSTAAAPDEEQTAPDSPDEEKQIGANPSLSEQSDLDSSVSGQAGEASSAAPKQSDPDLYVAPKRAGTGTSTSSMEYDAAISESPQSFISAEAAPEVGKMNTDYASADDASQSGKTTGFGMQLAQAFYEQAFLPLFSKYAPECMDIIAVGLAGEGSDCFGFDDAVSQDHDFGPGLCIWLTHEDYEAYGEQLSELYQMLPQEFNGYQRNVVIENGRVGVFDMDRFFARFTGYTRAEDIADIQSLLSIPDEALATVTNGVVFVDPVGEFSARRANFYKICPEEYWQVKIANSLLQLGQYGQYNYARSMKRGDYVTAQVALYKYIEELYRLVHYVNHAFPPYYKWLKKSSARFECLGVLSSLTEALADYADQRSVWEDNSAEAESRDVICRTVEYIALLILDELKKQGILENISIPEDETFLEPYGRAILQKIFGSNHDNTADHPSADAHESKNSANTVSPDFNDIGSKSEKNESSARPVPSAEEIRTAASKHDTETLINQIVHLEWAVFDAVQNEGGRASCQDDWNTFSIMRKSQYLAWPEELLLSYMQDFLNANARGWNLITEKYGRMMKSTDPRGYQEIQDQLPQLDPTREAIIEQIVSIQVAWMEQFAVEYPCMAGNSRTIHTSEDTPYDTSYETYLRGELGTYSKETLKLYGRFIVSLRQTGQNLAEIIMTNTALLYGYESLQDAENALHVEQTVTTK